MDHTPAGFEVLLGRDEKNWFKISLIKSGLHRWYKALAMFRAGNALNTAGTDRTWKEKDSIHVTLR